MRFPASAALIGLALAVGVCVTGLLATELRLLVAGLPLGRGLFTVPLGESLLRGVVLTLIAVGLLAGFCLAAYAGASRRWDRHGPDWVSIVHSGGVRQAHAARMQAPGPGATGAAVPATSRDPRLDPATPAGRLLRVVAGFNLIALSAVLGLAAAQFVAEFSSAWWAVLPAGVIVALVLYELVIRLGPLHFAPAVHVVMGVLIAAIGLLASPPVGILVLAALVLATAGRRLARDRALAPGRRPWASPLPWLAVGLYGAVVIGYQAMPPVVFDAVAVGAPATQAVGADLADSATGVHLLQCIPLADATSTDTRLRFIAAAHHARAGQAAFDRGARPSLVALVLGVAGLPGPRAVFVPNLHARRATCAGADPPRLSIGTEVPAPGAGVLAEPAGPPGGRAQDGELPIEQTTNPVIARLARRYQPTLEVTVADRFWPVSVGAVLADIGPGGTRTCLFASQTAARCSAPSGFGASANSTAYLRFPSTSDFRRPAVTADPASQFAAFERGEATNPGALHHWLADPGVLDPWRTAQMYFYFAGAVHFHGIPGQLPGWPASGAIDGTPVATVAKTDGLIGLQYWFFYPYNYYPLVVRSALMNLAPLAGSVRNVDLHQGDWEHVAVLLNARTLAPAFLYTARHADEGAFYAWTGGGLSFDSGHPIVQAAFGGHPSYPSGCGQYVRTKHGGGLMSDWRSCGSGRFAFRAVTTPLVDLAAPDVPWACWPGHFGEARYGFEVSDPNADWFTTVINEFVNVAGPRSPLWQAENGSVNHQGVCRVGAASAERDALRGALGVRLAAAVQGAGR